MAIFGASFQIGRSALAAYQAALNISGQNIANVGNPDYTRQTGQLSALLGGSTTGVTPGGGVILSSLTRQTDSALEARLRDAFGASSGSAAEYQTLNQVEGMFNSLSDQDVSSLLSQFFGSFGNLQTSPADSTSRSQVLTSAQGLLSTLHRQRGNLLQTAKDLNTQIGAAADQANQLAGQIANLNKQISIAESGGRTIASALRDQRDAVTRKLSELMDIQVREQPNGAFNVYVGSEPLVQFGTSRGIKVDTKLENGLEKATIRFADNNGNVKLRSGKLAGLLAARDNGILDQLNGMDKFAKGLIYEVNKIHSTGVGLVGHTQLSGTYAAKDANQPLNSAAAGLDFPVQNGTFIVHMRDATSGAEITRQIEVDLDGLNNDDTTLNSLASALGNVPGLTATVSTDNRLQLTAAAGQEFFFTDDRSGAVAALGLGTFFSGTNAGDIAINPDVESDPRLIAASGSGLTNDGDNAGKLAALAADSAGSTLLNNQSISGFQAALVGKLATLTASAGSANDASQSIYDSLQAQRESISGVSLDEESVNLMKFQQAFEGSARYISVLDQLSDSVMSLLR